MAAAFPDGRAGQLHLVLDRAVHDSPPAMAMRRALPPAIGTGLAAFLLIGLLIGYLQIHRPLRQLQRMAAAVAGPAPLVPPRPCPVSWRGSLRR